MIIFGYPRFRKDNFKSSEAIRISQTLRYNIPVVQLVHEPASDILGSGLVISNMTLWEKCNSLILLPNCFGFRQKPDVGMAFLINKIINKNPVTSTDDNTSWVYAEDVASLIWFVIENKIAGEIKMPRLGTIPLTNLLNILSETLEIPVTINEITNLDLFAKENRTLVSMLTGGKEMPPGNSDKIKDWLPDSVNLLESIKKTARWYKVNRWAL